MSLRFPASENPAVFAVQKTLVEAWTIVEEAFVDGKFGGRHWDTELGDALLAAYQAENGEKAYSVIRGMLGKLGDPFTRIVPPQCALAGCLLAQRTTSSSATVENVLDRTQLPQVMQ